MSDYRRIKITRQVHVNVNGQMALLAPESVTDVPKDTAAILVGGGKAVYAKEAALREVTDYVPDYAKNPVSTPGDSMAAAAASLARAAAAIESAATALATRAGKKE